MTDQHAPSQFTPTEYDPPLGDLEILYEDDHLLAVNKPHGLLSVPGRGPHLGDCLIARVQETFPMALLVHRLDRDTSGVIVFAMTPHAQRGLSAQFEARSTKKTYIARVLGDVTPRAGEVDLPLIVDWPNRPLQKVCYETGKEAVTDYKVMKSGGGESRMRLTPKTGRSHQLRVHMLALGHPILGDPLYMPDLAANYPRMMLHAEELRVNHPDTGKGLKFRAKAGF